MKSILFDIDGTLLLTGGAGKIALERAFDEMFHVKNAWGQIVPDGKTDPLIVEEMAQGSLGRFLESDEYQTLCQLYSRYFLYEINRADRYQLMPGVEELLKHLSSQSNIIMGLATGNIEEVAYLKLERGGIRQYFHFGGFGSDSRDRTELTRIAVQRGREYLQEQKLIKEVYLVGDSVYDIRAGKQLGIQTVAVATGRTERNKLESETPDLFMDNLTATKALIDFVAKGKAGE